MEAADSGAHCSQLAGDKPFMTKSLYYKNRVTSTEKSSSSGPRRATFCTDW
jgi:hypothetical protein